MLDDTLFGLGGDKRVGSILKDRDSGGVDGPVVLKAVAVHGHDEGTPSQPAVVGDGTGVPRDAGACRCRLRPATTSCVASDGRSAPRACEVPGRVLADVPSVL